MQHTVPEMGGGGAFYAKKRPKEASQTRREKGGGEGRGGGVPIVASTGPDKYVVFMHADYSGIRILDKFIIQMVKICSNFKQFSFWILVISYIDRVPYFHQ